MRRVHPVAIAIAALGALFAMSVEARVQEAGGETIGALPPETSTSAEPTDPTRHFRWSGRSLWLSGWCVRHALETGAFSTKVHRSRQTCHGGYRTKNLGSES
jgi:hypothetical protein